MKKKDRNDNESKNEKPKLSINHGGLCFGRKFNDKKRKKTMAVNGVDTHWFFLLLLV